MTTDALAPFGEGRATAELRKPTYLIDKALIEIAAPPFAASGLREGLPGLLERPELAAFSRMSLHQLQELPRGRLSLSDLHRVDHDLRLAFHAPALRLRSWPAG